MVLNYFTISNNLCVTLYTPHFAKTSILHGNVGSFFKSTTCKIRALQLVSSEDIPLYPSSLIIYVNVIRFTIIWGNECTEATKMVLQILEKRAPALCNKQIIIKHTTEGNQWNKIHRIWKLEQLLNI